MRRPAAILLGLLAVLTSGAARAQQVSDMEFRPAIDKPAFPAGDGPLVLIDEAHHNFHTASGRYQPFAELLRRDGYVVKPSTSSFTGEALKDARLLVISNALNAKNEGAWDLPHLPAFTSEETRALESWIRDGGSLLLIADHAPFAGAAQELGAAVGVQFRDGYALPRQPGGLALMFRKSDQTLREHPVTRDVTEVATFTGSSFTLIGPGTPLLVFGPDVYSSPKPNGTDREPVGGHLQGALLTVGKGRVAVFGEAAMFSAQLAGPGKVPVGMNAPGATQNARLLRNVVHWLTAAP